MVINGNGEVGPCANDSSVKSPAGWDTSGDITQIAYDNNHIYNRVNGVPGPV